jgi:hypothetical protein
VMLSQKYPCLPLIVILSVPIGAPNDLHISKPSW